MDPDVDPATVHTEGDLLKDCPNCTVWSCDACGARGDNAFHTLKCPVARTLRDCWCTPKWLAELIGWVHLDPCSNLRSHIQAYAACYGDNGFDGLRGSPGGWYGCRTSDGMVETGWMDAFATVFVNPPYSRGSVVRWVRHWRHTRFIFLLRWDPSTEWFAELIPHCTHVWFPKERIGFEPPPHVSSSSNPFPHALYLRNPSTELLARLAPHGYLMTLASA